jgi:hypothetical protein
VDSLRELAAIVAVSPRMLVHHFGSREQRCPSRCARHAHASARSSRRQFGHLHAFTGTPGSPYADFLRESVVDWLPSPEHGFTADRVEPVAARFGADAARDLAARGHDNVSLVPDWDDVMGHAQAIRVLPDHLEAAADPRGDGAALGL